jgi:fumarylacetoacetase
MMQTTNPLLDETHDATLTSWVESANDPATEFPIQNLPLGRFKGDGDTDWSIGVAIGDRILPLRQTGLVHAAEHDDMNRLMAAGPETRRALRLALSRGLRAGSAQQAEWSAELVPMSDVELGLPCHIGDYTDFYTSIHHATAVGRQFRPDNPLLPNYKWVPIGYHGRASSIIASGGAFHRPRGQFKLPDKEMPEFGPSRRLDYELEVAVLIGQANPQGDPVSIDHAEEHVFGLGLFNDWTARDIQAWEYQPLGPFLSKNFASTLSPWIVTLDAMAPFRVPYQRPAEDPSPLPYLDSPANTRLGAFDVTLEVWLQTESMRASGSRGQRLMQSSFKDSYWTIAQMVTHHTVNGCNLMPGDLFGSGTQSGPQAGQGGSLLELSIGGKSPITLENGETRGFLQDGDTVILRGYCEAEGFRRIGFGECSGTVLPAK